MPSAILSELARDICTCCSVIQHLWGKHWIAPLRGRLQSVPRGSGPETSVGGRGILCSAGPGSSANWEWSEASPSCVGAEWCCCVTWWELLAVVHFKYYLCGIPFTIRTDHAPLLWLMSFQEPECSMTLWSSERKKLLGQEAFTAPTCCMLQVVDAAKWSAC